MCERRHLKDRPREDDDDRRGEGGGDGIARSRWIVPRIENPRVALYDHRSRQPPRASSISFFSRRSTRIHTSSFHLPPDLSLFLSERRLPTLNYPPVDPESNRLGVVRRYYTPSSRRSIQRARAGLYDGGTRRGIPHRFNSICQCLINRKLMK